MAGPLNLLKNIGGTIFDLFQIGQDGPVLERVAGTARLKLPNLLRWLPGGSAVAGLFLSNDDGDLSVFDGAAGSIIYHNGTNWVTLTEPAEIQNHYFRYNATTGLPEWVILDSGDLGGSDSNISNKSGIDLSFGANSGIDYKEINSTSWEVVTTFIFHGTDHFTPTFFKAIVAVSGIGTAGDLRLVDYSNGGNVIAEISTGTSQDKHIIVDSTLSNLPAEEAVLEFQAKRGSRAIKIYFCTLR